MLKLKPLLVALGKQEGKRADPDVTAMVYKTLNTFPRHQGRVALRQIVALSVVYHPLDNEVPESCKLYFGDKTVDLGPAKETDFGWQTDEVSLGFAIPQGAVFFVRPAIK